MKKYDKLVRDNIPKIIEESGQECKYHIADNSEYYNKLVEKLNEEVQEFNENPCVEELADIQEVLDAISRINQWDVHGARNQKNRTNGAFYRKYILEEVR